MQIIMRGTKVYLARITIHVTYFDKFYATLFCNCENAHNSGGQILMQTVREYSVLHVLPRA